MWPSEVVRKAGAATESRLLRKKRKQPGRLKRGSALQNEARPAGRSTPSCGGARSVCYWTLSVPCTRLELTRTPQTGGGVSPGSGVPGWRYRAELARARGGCLGYLWEESSARRARSWGNWDRDSPDPPKCVSSPVWRTGPTPVCLLSLAAA